MFFVGNLSAGFKIIKTQIIIRIDEELADNKRSKLKIVLTFNSYCSRQVGASKCRQLWSEKKSDMLRISKTKSINGVPILVDFIKKN